jgi:rhodanese-related sulfurtransferase
MDLKNWYKIFALSFILLANLSGQQNQVLCINPEFQQEVNSYLSFDVPIISVSEAYEKKASYTFLDAREKSEFDISHIKDAVHVGYDDFDIKSVAHLDKSEPLVIYCSIGYRSEKIGKKLKRAGFENVQNLYGSIFEWVNQHHHIYNSVNKKTNEIHTFNKKWSMWVQSAEVEKVW